MLPYVIESEINNFYSLNTSEVRKTFDHSLGHFFILKTSVMRQGLTIDIV